MYFAVSGSDRASRRGGSPPLRAGPDAASIAAYAAATSGSVGETAGSGSWPASGQDVVDRATPRSDERS